MTTSKLPTGRDLRGNVVTIADLPAATQRRWTPNRKAVVVSAVQNGIISLEAVLSRYDMTEQEFRLWEAALREPGAHGLKSTQYSRRKASREEI